MQCPGLISFSKGALAQGRGCVLVPLLCHHCFRKLQNPVVTEPLICINETQICFSTSSCGSVTYYKNVFDEIKFIYFHVVKINLVVGQRY